MVNVVNRMSSKKESTSKAKGLVKSSTGSVRHSVTKKHPKETIKYSNLQLHKKSHIPSAFAIPETPKLKIKQYCSQHSPAYGCDNTVACVPETPLLNNGEDTGLSVTAQ